MFPSAVYGSVGQITNTLIYSSNWWEAGGATGTVAAYAAKGAASYAASKINLANPGTYGLVEFGAGTNNVAWSATRGWWFPGWKTSDNKALDTGIFPEIGVWTVICSVANCADPPPNFSAAFGAAVAGFKYLIVALQTPFVGKGVRYYAPGGVTVLENISSAAVYTVAGRVGYKNGVAVAWPTGTSAAASLSLKLGGYQEPGDTDIRGPFYADIRALSVYNNTLSAAQVAAVSAAMAAL